MAFTKNDAVAAAKQDLASRVGTDEADITEVSVTEKDFPDMSLGAPVDGEMSAQMISTGWEIELAAQDATYLYRADKYQLRLVDFRGRNFVVGNS
jgi:hypothetical protein